MQRNGVLRFLYFESLYSSFIDNGDIENDY